MPARRIRVLLSGQAFDVLHAEGAWVPTAGETCDIDLSLAHTIRGWRFWYLAISVWKAKPL
jgi:hypothetical protein